MKDTLAVKQLSKNYTPLPGMPFKIAKWVLVAACTIVVAACQFAPAQRATPTETPSAAVGSIQGIVGLDGCSSGELCPTVTPELIQNTSDGESTGFQGLAGIEVSLGQGPCPSLGLASQRTEANGTFDFSGLQPGFYCVSAQAGSSMNGQWSVPEALPAEVRASYTIALGPGEQRKDLLFIWNPAGKETPAAPTATPTSEPACTNRLSLVDDITIEDGERLDPGTNFRKVWRIRNEGTCTWTHSYEWVFVSGYQMNASDSIQIPAEVAPGVMMDVSLDMKAPDVSGSYRSYWMMRSPDGQLFGTGSADNQPVWVEITVRPEATPVISEWRGEYFDNRSLEGDPALIRNDKKIDFDWKRGAPADGLPSDNFSARWTRTLEFDAAVYRFSVASDDGVRLWVDDRLVIDEWVDSELNQETVDLAMVSGKHDIKLEYYEHLGGADIKLSWKKITPDEDSKWIGRFWFNRQRDSKWALVNTSSSIDFNWGSKSPALGIPSDNFSASWVRSIDFESGSYRFSVQADDGVRLYFDDELLIDEWHDASGTKTYSVEREVSGTHELQVIYYEHVGDAHIKFEWEKISPPNQPPVAKSDGYETMVDTSINVLDPGVLENDNDPDGDPITAIEVSGPSHGQLILHENGAFSYAPDRGYVGEDRFIYRASDGDLQSADTTVKITIQKENYLPAAVDDSVATQEDTEVSIDVLANDRGLGDPPISITSISTPSHGAASIEGNLIIYNPMLNFFGVDTFTYTISDSDGDESSAIVTVTVNAVNDPPDAKDDAYELKEDETLSLPDPGVLENDSDPENDPITAMLVEDVQHGKLKLNANGSFTYVPDENYSGSDQFTYSVSDGSKSSPAVVVTLTITPVEDLPIAVGDSFEVNYQSVLMIEKPGVLANDSDADGDELTAVLDQAPAHGDLVLNPDGSFEYTPDAGFEGSDSFSYWVEDGKGKSESVKVSIQVLPPA
jgi:VCBS repeat-containing protein